MYQHFNFRGPTNFPFLTFACSTFDLIFQLSVAPEDQFEWVHCDSVAAADGVAVVVAAAAAVAVAAVEIFWSTRDPGSLMIFFKHKLAEL